MHFLGNADDPQDRQLNNREGKLTDQNELNGAPEAQVHGAVKLTKKQNFLQGLKFLLFSCSAGLIQFSTFALFMEVFHLIEWASYLISLALSVLFNFTVNRKFTFKSAKNVPLAMMQILAYYLVFTPVSTWWVDALTKANWNAYLVEIGTMVINLVTEFSVYRFIVYRKHMFTNKQGQAELAKQREKEQQEEQEKAQVEAQGAS